MNKQIRDNLKRDNINPSQYKINMDYLNATKKYCLYPPEILKEFANHPCNYDLGNNEKDLITNLDLFLFDKSQKNLLKQVTPIIIRIAYNLNLPISSGKFFLPFGIQDNPTKFYWYIAAYPDVFDYFMPTRDLIKESDQEYIDYFDKLNKSRQKDYDACINITEKEYGELKKMTKQQTINSINYGLITQKNYYKDVLKKKYLLSN
ncbi:MAG: hypothetical protein ABH819_00695 [Patescibacteria group bacterium]